MHTSNAYVPLKRFTCPMKVQAFSLIELMIVIVIIAVLAGIAIPGFQDHVARAHVMAALSEVRALTTAYEDFTLRGIDEFEMTDLGLLAGEENSQTNRCRWSLTLPDQETGEGALSCFILGNPKVRDHELRLMREGTQGRWRCISDLPTQFRPESCQSDGA